MRQPGKLLEQNTVVTRWPDRLAWRPVEHPPTEEDVNVDAYVDARYTCVNFGSAGTGFVGLLDNITETATITGVQAEISTRVSSPVQVTLQKNGSNLQAITIAANRASSRMYRLNTSVALGDNIDLLYVTIPTGTEELSLTVHVYMTIAGT